MKTFSLQMTEQDMTILGQALGEMPFRVVAPLIERINQQVTGQLERDAPDATTDRAHLGGPKDEGP